MDLSLFQILGLLAWYFAPFTIAFARGHHNQMAIFALTALTGWTLIGWVAALIWYLTAIRKPLPNT